MYRVKKPQFSKCVLAWMFLLEIKYYKPILNSKEMYFSCNFTSACKGNDF